MPGSEISPILRYDLWIYLTPSSRTGTINGQGVLFGTPWEIRLAMAMGTFPRGAILAATTYASSRGRAHFDFCQIMGYGTYGPSIFFHDIRIRDALIELNRMNRFRKEMIRRWGTSTLTKEQISRMTKPWRERNV